MIPFQICSRDSFAPSCLLFRPLSTYTIGERGRAGGGQNYDTCESFLSPSVPRELEEATRRTLWKASQALQDAWVENEL